MKDTGYINGVEVDLKIVGFMHEARSKIAMGVKLTPKERSCYLLFAPIEETQEYLKNEEERK